WPCRRSAPRRHYLLYQHRYLHTVETPRFRGNPGWGRLRSGDIDSNRKGSSRQHQGKSRGPVPADSLRGVRRYRRLGDAPTGGSPRHGASLQWEAGVGRGTVTGTPPIPGRAMGEEGRGDESLFATIARPMATYYLTTPIYYVNGPPHLGHMYTTIVGDTLIRYRRMAGDETYFLTGTDEHGQNIERAARKEGIAPIELADRVVAEYRLLRGRLGFSYDDFVRTTEERHRWGVEEMIRRIEAAGDLYTAVHEGWYCSPCETFYTEKELAAGQTCPVHGTPVEWKSEENVFFRLSKYQQPLLDLYKQQPGFVRPATRMNEVRSFVESGLRDLSVSRASVEWGIPFPGHPGQTVYVWLDALTNYISALGFGGPSTAAYER